MRLLFLAPRFPWPQDDAWNQRTRALLRALATKHQVVFSTPMMDGLREKLREIEPWIVEFVPGPVDGSGHLSAFYHRQGRWWNDIVKCLGDFLSNPTPCRFRPCSPEWTNLLSERFDDFDGIICRYTYLLPVIPRHLWPRVILDADDLAYRFAIQHACQRPRQLTNALYFLTEAVRTYWYEQRVFRQVAQVLVCSERDEQRVRCRNKSIVRNGVQWRAIPEVLPSPTPNTLVSLGSYQAFQNVEGLRWFTRAVWPELLKLRPEARLRVIGFGATAERLPFAVLPGIDIVGPIDHWAEGFASGVCSIVPVQKGSGTRIKVIESLACGRPVITTTIGGEGLEFLDESKGIVRADHPRKMARSIAEALANPQPGLASAQEGRQWVAARLSWDATTVDFADNVEKWLRVSAR